MSDLSTPLSRLKALAEKATPGPMYRVFMVQNKNPVKGGAVVLVSDQEKPEDLRDENLIAAFTTRPDVKQAVCNADYFIACSPLVVSAFADLAVAADQTVNAPEVTGPGVLRDALQQLAEVLGSSSPPASR